MVASTGAQRTRTHLGPAPAIPRPQGRRPAPLDGAAARRSLDALRAGRIAPAADVMLLQRLVGNRAIGAVLRRPRVQRAVGWPKAAGWNKAARTIDAKHAMVRIPLAGLAKQNQRAAPNPTKTDEEAVGEAIVWLHPKLVPTQGVQVLVQLHGLTYRSVDPFAGYRENNADPKTDESETARAAAKKAKEKDFVNPLAGKVRDVERDRIGQQVEAMNDPQLMAVLPQGTGGAKFGENFDADAMVTEVLERLTTEKLLSEVPKKITILLSAHSAGGATAAGALKGKRTNRVGGLILFDALWGQPNEKDPTKTDSWQRDAVITWVRDGCKALAPTLKDTAKTADDKAAAIDALPGVRGYWESGYANTYEDLQRRMDAVVKQEIPAAYRAAVNAKFVVTKVGTTHDKIIGGNGGPGVDAGPLQDALQHRKEYVAPPVARQVQRDTPGPPPAKKTTAVKLTWKGDLKNSAQLQPVLDKHPADLNADVIENGKVVKTADTTATVDLSPAPVSHTFRVVPKATAPDNYFLPGSASVKVEKDTTKDVTVTLPFNRTNSRFTERTWEVTGIDVTKANDVQPATLFGKSVVGGLNSLVAGKVTAANTHFTTNASPAEQQAATASIVSIAGQVKRTQSTGAYSNHSTGVAIDINPREDSLQNTHVKKSDARHVKAMRLFNTVVSQPSAFDALVTNLARIVVPGVGNLSAFKDFDVWKERDRDRLLAASARFNAFFPDYLAALATQADPAQSPGPTASTVMALTAAQLTALVGKAKKAKKPDVAATLTDVADVWYQVRAWVGGFVITNKVEGGEAKGMLRNDFDKAKAKDPTLKSKGELTGMISLHPAIVKALTESGWTWLVDYKGDDQKDFMHFEDRNAEKELKKK